jgi:hypothetical protein
LALAAWANMPKALLGKPATCSGDARRRENALVPSSTLLVNVVESCASCSAMALKRALASPGGEEEGGRLFGWSGGGGGSCNREVTALTFKGNACMLRALNAFFNDAQLRLRQLLSVGVESALVLLVDWQALSQLEAKSDNLRLHIFNCSTQLIVVFDGLQVRDGRPACFHLLAERLERLEELFGRKLVARLLNLGL